MKNRDLNDAIADIVSIGMLLMLGAAIFQMVASALLDIATIQP